MKRSLKICLLALILVAATLFPADSGKVFAAEATAETLKVNLRIINVEGDRTQNENEEFAPEVPINASADIAISGAGASIPNAWAVITVPKTDKIAKPTFVSSKNAKSSVQAEDQDNWYMIYKFTALTGGSQMTFPFPFKFKEETVKDKDEVTVKLDIVDGNVFDNVNDDTPDITLQNALAAEKLYQTQKTYRAVKVTAEYNRTHTYAYAYNSTEGDVHVYNVEVNAGDTTTGKPGHRFAVGYFPTIDASKIGVEKYSLERPENLKLVIKVPEGFVPENPNRVSDGGKMVTSYDAAKGEITILHKNPAADVADGWRNGRPGKTYWIYYFAENRPLDTPYDFPAEYYVNADTNQERKLENTNVKVKFKPHYFQPSGSTWIAKAAAYNWTANPFDLWVDGNGYAISKGNLYDKAGRDQTENGLAYILAVANRNNGSGRDNPEGGNVADLYKVSDYLLAKDGNDNRTYYRYFGFFDVYTETNTNKYTEEQRAQQLTEVINAFDTTDNILYGVKRNGDRVELAKNIKHTDKVPILDKEGNYYKLDLEFAKPIRLNNKVLRFWTSVGLSNDEIEKFDNGTYPGIQLYTGYADAMVATGVTPGKDTTQIDYGRGDATQRVAPISPKSVISAGGNISLPYDAKGTYTTLEWYSYFHRNNGNWGFFLNQEIQNVKMILLLPPAFEYGGSTQRRFYQEKIEEPEVVRNFKNTGRTALIYTVPKVIAGDDKYNYSRLYTKILATPYAQRGNNKVDYYTVYDYNETVQPYSKAMEYIDELDLDGDNDRNEIFLHTESYINYIPPLELLISKKVGYQSNLLGTFATGDLGEDFYYGITVFNNTIADAQSAYVIDVLPYVGDHAIVANQEGEYKARESKFAVSLAEGLENLQENKDALERFEIFYQLSEQGEDFDSVGKGTWLSADKVDDFSKVKSIKMQLKAGQVIKPQEEITLYMHGKMPKSVDLPEGETAVNSSAVSTDGMLYSEGNEVSITFSRYSLSGVLFKDFNDDGIKDDNEEGVRGKLVELIDVATGEVAKDVNGVPYTAKTGEDGSYKFDLTKRGTYKVRFTKGNADVYTTPFVDQNDGNHIKEKNGNQGITKEVTLSPTSKTAILNGGLVYTKRDVKIQKISSLKGEDGSVTPLTDAVFELYQAGKLVQTQTTNKEGIAIFTDIPFGDAKIVEKKAPQGYQIMEMKGREIVVSPQNNEVIVFENAPEVKVDVQVSKQWQDENGQPLDAEVIKALSVKVELYKNGQKTGKQVILSAQNQWTDKFTGLLDTDTYQGAKNEYTVKEVDAKDNGDIKINNVWYKASIEGDAANGYTVTNKKIMTWSSMTPPTRNIKVKKVWKDDKGELLKEAELANKSIQVELYKNDVTTGQIKTLDAVGKWEASFTGLADRDGLNSPQHKYTVKEVGARDNGDIKIDDVWYKASVEGSMKAGYTITNKKAKVWSGMIPATTKLKVTKEWEKTNPDKAPEVTVFLVKNGEVTDQSKVLNAENKWTATFTNLPVMEADKVESADKKDINVYSVVEANVVDGKVAIDNKEYEVAYKGNNKIVNTLINPKISIEGNKVWEDAQNQDGIRPKEVTIRLFANGEDTQKTAKANEENGWVYSFTDLDTYDSEGEAINYTINEDAVEGYESRLENTTFINTHIPLEREITVSKTWVDDENAKGLRPELIVLHLYANDEEVAVQEVSANEDGLWMANFGSLPVNKAGEEIKYRVVEEDVAGYVTGYAGEAATGFAITNTIEGKVSIPVTKKWLGKEASYAEVILFADGKEVEKATLKADAGWKHVFADYPQYRDGKEIVYTVKESPIEGYSVKVEGDAKSGYTITNTEEKKPEIIKKEIKKKVSAKSKKATPKTGDNTQILVYVLVALFACLAIILVILRKKRNSRNRRKRR